MAAQDVILREVTVRQGGETLIERVSLSANAGVTTVLLGTTDSGATTTIKAVAGFVRVNEGRIAVGGVDVTRARAGRRNVAVVFEGHTLFPHMTIYENVAYPLRVARLEAGEIERRVGVIAERLGISKVLNERPRRIDESIRRRAGLARAIVRAPGAYLLDRTLASLDDDFRGAAREAIGFLRAQEHATILMPSADAVEAMQLADRVVVMANGGVLQEGPADEVRLRPLSLAVAELASAPVFAFQEGVVLAIEPGSLRVRLNDGVTLALPIKPRDVEQGERVTVATPRSALKDGGWGALEPGMALLFDSAGVALHAPAET